MASEGAVGNERWPEKVAEAVDHLLQGRPFGRSGDDIWVLVYPDGYSELLVERPRLAGGAYLRPLAAAARHPDGTFSIFTAMRPSLLFLAAVQEVAARHGCFVLAAEGGELWVLFNHERELARESGNRHLSLGDYAPTLPGMFSSSPHVWEVEGDGQVPYGF